MSAGPASNVTVTLNRGQFDQLLALTLDGIANEMPGSAHRQGGTVLAKWRRFRPRFVRFKTRFNLGVGMSREQAKADARDSLRTVDADVELALKLQAAVKAS